MRKLIIALVRTLLMVAQVGLAQTPFLINDERHGIDLSNSQFLASPQPSAASHQQTAWAAATDTVFRILPYSTAYLVIAKNGLFRAADTSTALANLNAPFPTDNRTVIRTFPALLGWNTVNYNGVFRSLNDGASWTQLNVPLALNSASLFTDLAGNMFVHNIALYRSTDNGNTWRSLNTGFNTAGYSFFLGSMNGHIFAANTSGSSLSRGLFRTIDNGDNWTQLPLPLPAGHRVFTMSIRSDALAFAITDSNNVSATRRLYRSTDNGQTWILANVPQANNLAFSPIAGTVFVTSLDGTVRRSNNNGQTWILTSLAGFSSFVPLWFSGDSVFAFNSTQGSVAFFRSTNNGETWENLNAPLRNWSFLRISFPIYVTGDSSVYRFGADNRWAKFVFPEPLESGLTIGLSISSPYLLAFGSRFDVALRTVVGQTSMWQLHDDTGIWQKARLPDQTKFFWLQMQTLHTIGNVFYLGTFDSGVLRSADQGLTWTPLLPSATSVAETNRPIRDFSLHQNYPNPFNPSTQISFALPQAQKVTLKVFDLTGKEVATLLQNTHKPAGAHEVIFAAGQLASGVYLYRLQAGEWVETKKMILVR
ncbi:T9SS type A sorting domain-containing protein [bacterium]|nr:T9SS type A sorting domain-containing protein [bacterium]